jgi:Arc/MetJ-type ribon-helix-helix transcriptional regulator
MASRQYGWAADEGVCAGNLRINPTRSVYHYGRALMFEIDKSNGMTYRNTIGRVMPRAKIAISLDERVLEELDRLVRNKAFPNRSRAIEKAIEEKLERHARGRLARECSSLDPADEKALAEEGLNEELAGWPEY